MRQYLSRCQYSSGCWLEPGVTPLTNTILAVILNYQDIGVALFRVTGICQSQEYAEPPFISGANRD